MTETPKELLFDWETVLLQGPLEERLGNCLSLRLSVSRGQARSALGDLDREILQRGEISLSDLCHRFGEAFARELPREDLTECLHAAVIYDLDGLGLLSRWASLGKATVVGGSPPQVPEKLRSDLAPLLPPERHVYAHEAGHSLESPEFFAVVAEALGTQVGDLVLLSRNPAAREAAKAAGAQWVDFQGPHPALVPGSD